MADSKRLRLAWTAAVLAVLVITPLVVVAADRFEDVPDSNIFHDDIGWLADAGVTRGCNPPENTRFCPDDGVTRAQMAAFMRRLAENRVVDAATASEADHAATADVADSAQTADHALTADTADSAAEADHAASADIALSAEEADHADTADSAAVANDAQMLGGNPPSEYTTVVFGGGTNPGTVEQVEQVFAEASFTVETDGFAVVRYSMPITLVNSGLSDVTAWLQLNDSECAEGSELPGSLSIVTVADSSIQPPLGNASSSTIVELAAGTHNVYLCAEIHSEVLLGTTTVSGVFSPVGSGVVDEGDEGDGLAGMFGSGR